MADEPIEPESSGSFRGISAEDIFHWEFRRSLTGGYAVNEVDDFLEEVGAAFDALVTRMELLDERDQEQRQRIEAYRRSEDTLRDALKAAQKFNEDIIGTARREADALRAEARAIKARAQLEAAELPQAIAEEVRILREQRARLRAELNAVLDTHRRLLDSVVHAEEQLEKLSGAHEPPSGEETQRAEPAAGAPDSSAPGGQLDSESGEEIPNAFFSGGETWQ